MVNISLVSILLKLALGKEPGWYGPSVSLKFLCKTWTDHVIICILRSYCVQMFVPVLLENTTAESAFGHVAISWYPKCIWLYSVLLRAYSSKFYGGLLKSCTLYIFVLYILIVHSSNLFYLKTESSERL